MKMKKILAAVLAATTVFAGAAGFGPTVGVSAATLPDVDVNAFWGAHSQGVEITSTGVTVDFKSTTYSDATGNYNTPVYVIYTSSDGMVGAAGDAGYTEYWVQRSDNYGWIGDANTADVSKLPAGYTYTAATFADGFDWAAWLAANKAGVDCKLTAKLDGDKAVVSLTNNGVTSTVSAPVDTSQKVYVALTGEQCKLTNITTTDGVAASDGSSNTDRVPVTANDAPSRLPDSSTPDNGNTGTTTPDYVEPQHGKYWFEWFGASSMDGGSYYMYCATAMDDGEGYYVRAFVDVTDKTDVNEVIQSALKDSHLTGNLLGNLDIETSGSENYISYTIKKDVLAQAKAKSDGTVAVSAQFGNRETYGTMSVLLSDASNDLEVNPKGGVSNNAVNTLLTSSGFTGANYQITIPGTGYLPGATSLSIRESKEGAVEKSAFGDGSNIKTYLYYYNVSKNLLELIPDSSSYWTSGKNLVSYYIYNLYKKGTYVITNAELPASITTGKMEIYTPGTASTDKEIAEAAIEKIKSLDKDTTLQIVVPNGKKIEKSVFQAAKDQGVKLTLVSNAGSTVFWNFAAITNADVDFDPTVTVDASIEAVTKKVEALKLPETTKFVQVSFAYDGTLPGEADVVLDLSGTGKFTVGSKVYMYLYDPKDDSFKEEKEAVYQEDGTVTFKMTHCSDYIITSEKLTSGASTAPTPTESEAKDSSPAKTGDSSMVFVYMLLLLAAAAGTAMIVLKKRNCR